MQHSTERCISFLVLVQRHSTVCYNVPIQEPIHWILNGYITGKIYVWPPRRGRMEEIMAIFTGAGVALVTPMNQDGSVNYDKLKEVIEQVLSFIPEKERKEAVKKSCQRCFQALRIDVNQEFEVLESFLSKLPGILAPGGRAAILTFHSGEDRLVKYYFKDGKKEGIYSDVASDVIRPSAEECQRNPRARSTKMRWAIRDGENPHRM